ncbi:DNA damage-inducible protein D [Candidatus Peregrinibacteria bacterium CG10_big_fil_rev_8_21_14_0_10_54_7]|nr:MAG: DNA damage-inducible protein D [Candidatus Peregrinibacteria bacterium CG10_big_fil_rev_8_21_14_0_10_54_7]
MKPQLIEQYRSSFEQCARQYKGVECWSARDLQLLMGYEEWRNFVSIIEKAVESCQNSQQEPKYHFVEVNKLIETGKGAQRQVQDFLLTRFACYLVAQNGDPRKEVIAFAQSYFALQTRKQEIIEERIALQERINARAKLTETEKRLSENLYERGVDEKGFARIRSKGDAALFGGHTTGDMKKKLGIKSGALADYLPTITIKAKDFATELTNFNVEKGDMQGEGDITKEHIKNNQGVRKLLKERGIEPEKLSPAEDIKKLKRSIAKHEKKLAGGTPRFP